MTQVMDRRVSFAHTSALASRDHYQEWKRTSDLMAPTMVLQGHGGEIYTAQFSPDGEFLASAGYDMQVGNGFWKMWRPIF